MKKASVFFIFTLAFLFAANAQMRVGKDRPADVKMRYEIAKEVKATTLMVAIDEEQPEYTALLKSSVEKYWTHTDYEFINNDQVLDYVKKNKCSVLAMIRRATKSGKTETVQGYQFAIFLGDSKNTSLNTARIAFSVDLPDKWSNKEGSQLMDFEYLIPFFIKSLNFNVDRCLKKVVNKSFRRKSSIYSENGIKDMPGKTVLIYEKAMDEKFKMPSFCKNFGLDPNKVKIADKSEIASAIESGDESIAIVYSINAYGSIYDAKTTESLAWGSGRNLTGKKIYYYGCGTIALFLFIYEAATGGL